MLTQMLGRSSQRLQARAGPEAPETEGFSVLGLVLTTITFVAFAGLEDVLSEILEAGLGLPSLLGAVTIFRESSGSDTNRGELPAKPTMGSLVSTSGEMPINASPPSSRPKNSSIVNSE